MSVDATKHPTDETLASFAEGEADAKTRAEVLSHLEMCVDCSALVLGAVAHVREEQPEARAEPPVRTSSRWWLAVAAAMLLAVVAVPLLRREQPMARLVAVAPRSARAVEPRLSGGFAWAPYRGPMRASDAAANTEQLKVGGAAAEAIEAAQRRPSDETNHAAGVAMMLVGTPEDAIGRLRDVAEHSPGDVRVWNDLAAARYAAAIQLERQSLLPEALAAADRAVAIDAQSPEVLFNRALILERLGVTREARAAWERYLAVDASSPWANEARQRLSRLPAQTGVSMFREELPRLERAAVANDGATVSRIVGRFAQQSRAHAEAEHLGQWGDAWQRGHVAEADRVLTIARAVGKALASTTGESLLRDAVATIDRAGAARRQALAGAHGLYRRGRMAYAEQQLDDAERDLREAGSRFAQLQSPMAFAARYFAASARFDRHEVTPAHAELAQLVAELETEPRYTAMAAQVRWELALCYMVDADWSGAVSPLAQAEAGFRTLGERANLGAIRSLTATVLTSLGRPDEAWAARIRAFEGLSAEGDRYRLTVSLGAAARNELRTGRLDAALAMLELEEDTARDGGDQSLLVDTLVRQAVLDVRLDDDAAAARVAREAGNVLPRIGDPALRARAKASVDFANGAIALPANPARARQLLTSSIDAYRALELPVFLPDLYLLRARAAKLLGDDAAAIRDLDDGIVLVERHRVDATGVLDAGNALFEDAIRLQLDRGDAARAFAYAERARSETIDAATLQRRLAGTNTAVLELVALPSELVAFCITSGGLISTRTPVARERLAATTDPAALHDLLLAPVTLGAAGQLIVIPDARLAGVPFAALYDSRVKQHLVERMAVAIATSAASLQRSSRRRAAPSVLVVALPSGATRTQWMATATLPEAARELVDVGDAWRGSHAIVGSGATFAAFAAAAPRAGIIHIAGHTERTPGAGDPALLFADERVSGGRIARMSLPGSPTVMLSACETLRTPPDPQTHGLTLGGGFLAAGAESVIGTLTPIGDVAARELFGAIHRELAAGAEPAEAVRTAQRAAIARGADPASWKSIAVLTRRITGSGQGG